MASRNKSAVFICVVLTLVMVYLIVTGVQKKNAGIVNQKELSEMMHLSDSSDELVETDNGDVVFKYNSHRRNASEKDMFSKQENIQFGPGEIRFGH